MTAYEEVTPTETNGTDAHSATAEYVLDALTRAQTAFEATLSPTIPQNQRHLAIVSYIHHVTAAVLHECFAHVFPDRARLAVDWLEGALEDDTAAQWVYEARTAVAAGQRIPLPFDETTRVVSQ